jgi:hypothetical protein
VTTNGDVVLHSESRDRKAKPRPRPAAGRRSFGGTVPARIRHLQRTAGNRAASQAAQEWTIRPPRELLIRPAQSPPVKNPFEDPAATRDATSAAAAFDAYRALSDEDKRRCVKASYKTTLRQVLAKLKPPDPLGSKSRSKRPPLAWLATYQDDLRKIGRWVQEEETRAAAGAMTDDPIADEQMRFLSPAVPAAAGAATRAPDGRPTPGGAEVAAQHQERLKVASFKPPAPSVWDGLSDKEKAKWTKDGEEAIGKILKCAAKKFPELELKESQFRLAFWAVEQRGANVLAFCETDDEGRYRAAVGFAFVSAANIEPEFVLDVVVHELFGHPSYGEYATEYQLALYDAAMAKTTGYVKPDPGTPERLAEYRAYGYPETEMYALLVSLPYHTPVNPILAGRVPIYDMQKLVIARLQLMEKLWAQKLIVPILRGFRTRLAIDPRITEAALKILDHAVWVVFGGDALDRVKGEVTR